MPFVHQTTIRFSEVDAAQVVYFSRLFELAHVAFEELMCAAGFPVGEVFSKGDWGMPLVHSQADYRRPWRLGEQVRIEGRILEMTDRRVAFEYGFFDQEGTRRTRVEMHHAFVSLDSFKARSIPPGFREAMMALGLVGEG